MRTFTHAPSVREELRRIRRLAALAGKRSDISLKKLALFVISVALSGVVVLVLRQVSTLPQEAIYMSGIFVLSALLWVTEALPLFATAIAVIALEVVLLANPGGWEGLGFTTGEGPSYKTFFAPMASPIIYLFFGGFILAQAAVKEGVDKALASSILKIFGSRPAFIMLGMMSITAVFSMWMSNTATTAMMITLVIPILAQMPKGERFGKGLVLAIPFAANVGGMGTPIASPPNAVAVAFLRDSGIDVGFLDWMLVSVPLMIGMLALAWLVLYLLFKPKTNDLGIKAVSQPIDGRGWYVIFIFSITILLWLTAEFHGLPSGVVALLPAIAFTATGILGRSDINSLEWHILILIGGGIALGTGMKLTGLDVAIVGLIPAEGRLVFGLMVVATLLLSTFMSNTAAANLVLPLGVSFAMTAGVGMGADPDVFALELGISIALAASMAMSLPISTPPNAIAYSRGILSTKDFVLAGAIMGVIALLLIVGLGRLVIGFWMG